MTLTAPAPPGPATPAVADDSGKPGPRRPYRALTGVARRPGLLLAVLFCLLVLAWAALPGVFATHDPLRTDPGRSLLPPGAEHWFGTDGLGRDLYSRVVHGARVSLLTGLAAVGVSLAIGVPLGVLAGHLGGAVDQLTMRAVEILLVIPGLLLSLALVSILGFGIVNVALAVGVAGIPGFARVTRAETLRIRGSTYMLAAEASGTRTPVTLVRHVLPNASQPVLVLATLELGSAVLSVAALSFLGYGAAPPAPELGALVAEGRDFLATAWWLTTFPGLAVALLVLSVNRLGRALERNGGAA